MAIPWIPAVRPKYLADCGDCTTSTPCSEACGWDPGKGGPVTCGEFGVCQFTCPCSCTVSTTYGSWYNSSAYLSGAAVCMKSSTLGRRRHDERVIVERLNVYRNDWVCSGCASGPTACCSGLCFPIGNACNPGC